MRSAPNVYAEQLFRLSYGWPLWIPEPREVANKPDLIEVEIGDVGCTTSDGRFIRLFNAMVPKDDPKNFNGTPEEYHPLDLPDAALETIPGIIRDAAVVSRTVQVLEVSASAGGHASSASFSFKCIDNQGAFLVLKEAPTQKRLIDSNRQIIRYIAENYKRWLEFAEKNNMDIEEKRLQFVDGWIKTNAFVLGAITEQGKMVQFGLTADFSGTASATITFSSVNRMAPAYHTRAGPACADTTSEEARLPLSQCVFMNYFKVKRRVKTLWKPRVMKAASEPRDSAGKRDDESSNDGVRAMENGGGELVIEHAPNQEQAYDPVEHVLDYILENSTVNLAIAGDRQLLAACGGTVPKDIRRYLDAIRPKVEVVHDGVGTICLQIYSLLASSAPQPIQIDHVTGNQEQHDETDAAPNTLPTSRLTTINVKAPRTTTRGAGVPRSETHDVRSDQQSAILQTSSHAAQRPASINRDQVHPADLYAQELFKRKYGWSLWQPEPLDRRSETGEPNLVEVCIGNVGWIIEGSFRPLFNLNAIDTEPSKPPDGHVPMPIPPDGLVRKDNFLKPHAIVRRSMTLVGGEEKIDAHSVGASFDIECMKDQAAFLVLRDEAIREYLSNLVRRISNYFISNYKSWLQYERDFGLDADESQLIFIAGWVKTSEWALGIIAQKGRASKLHFDADFSTATAQLTVKAESKSWPAVDKRVVQGPEQNGAASRPQRNKGKKGKGKQRWDPDAPTLADVVENAEASVRQHHEPSGLPRNQCVFINYFKLRKRYVILTDVIKAAGGPDDLPKYNDSGKADAVGVELHPPLNEEGSLAQQPTAYDPVNFVLHYISRNSEAEVVIASDTQSLLLCGDAIPDDIPSFLNEKQPIEVTKEGGMLLLSTDGLPATSTFASQRIIDARPEAASEYFDAPPDTATHADITPPSVVAAAVCGTMVPPGASCLCTGSQRKGARHLVSRGTTVEAHWCKDALAAYVCDRTHTSHREITVLACGYSIRSMVVEAALPKDCCLTGEHQP